MHTECVQLVCSCACTQVCSFIHRKMSICFQLIYVMFILNTLPRYIQTFDGWSVCSQRILRFVDPASCYICVMKTNLMHCLSSVYFANYPLNEFHPKPSNSQSNNMHNKYQLLYIYRATNMPETCRR